MTDILQVATTIDSPERAQELARQLVERRLAACVQVVGPIASTYRWQDAVEQSQEWLCLIKTTAANYAALEAAIRALHPYDVPEIIATPVAAGNPDYLAWVEQETRDAR